MKIARIIYDWPPPWQGLAAAPYEITKSQSKLGHQIDVFCGRWPNAGPIESLPNTNTHWVYRAPFEGTISFTSSIVMFFKYLKWRKRNTPDILHIHGHFGLWIYLYREFLDKFFPWAKELNAPVVAHFHNTVRGRRVKLEENDSPIKNISKYIDWPLAELSDRLAVKNASACVFVSEDLKNDAIKYYKADASKCFVVETGVNPETFSPVSPDEKVKTRIELGLQPEDKVVLFVGALLERKNVHLLINAISLLPKNYKLEILGEGELDYTSKLDLQIREKNLQDRVRRIGYSPYPYLPIAYQSADLLVLPSSFEGLPKVVMESLACGTPALASGFKLQNELGGVRYLQNIEVNHIAEQIKDCIQNPSAVDIYTIKKNYSWDTKAQELDKIYEYAKQAYSK